MYKYKIAICGKAKSGKNTLAKMIKKELSKNEKVKCDYVAFADPVKEIARVMFPNLSEKYLTGPSEYRSYIIPGAIKDGQLLTVRQLLIDIGTGLGRSYNNNIWLENFDFKIKNNKSKNKNMVILTDCRFKNEFDYVKNKGFFTVKVLRRNSTIINHISETEQDTISESDFDYVIHNNGSLDSLRKEVKILVKKLQEKDAIF